MTSDFDNDEIKDSAFPVEFTDDKAPLDQYGVWVKSGPRDPGTPRAETESARVSLATLPSDDDFLDVGDLSAMDELPDFGDPGEGDVLPEIEDFVIESRETALPSENPEKSVDLSDLDFNIVDESELFETDDSETGPETETGTASVTVFEEIAQDTVEPALTVSEFETELVVEDFVPEEDAAVPSESGILPSDDEFSSFLDDLNNGAAENIPDGEDDSLDLDSFVDAFNDSGGMAHVEGTKVYEDIDPVDLVLEFDESFLEDAEKIRATGASVSESEFYNSEFGVELVDESAAKDSPLNDDDVITISDKTVGTEKSARNEASGSSVFEEAIEFDDLLQSLDTAPAQQKSEDPVSASKPRSFSLEVMEEDGFDSPRTTVNENASTEDIDVPLFGAIKTVAEPLTKEENLDILDIRDYNDTDLSQVSAPDVPLDTEDPMAPDFDDIRAVEQELNDLTPDTGDEQVVTSDKSTELLMIIADELSSIKKEISTLKSELSSFKTAGLTAEPTLPVEQEAVQDNSGFFSDDDTDETIALTGDELNNILITADFTEEKSETGEPSGDGALSGDAPETPAADSIFAVPDEPEIPETLPDSIFEMPKLDAEVPIEVAHVNTIQEDVSYLEGSDSNGPELDDVAIEEPNLETIDFNDEKLEEPELTEFNIDLSDIEKTYSAGQDIPLPDVTTENLSVDSLSVSDESRSVAVDISDFVKEEPPTGLDEPVLDSPEPASAAPAKESVSPARTAEKGAISALPVDLKNEIKSVLSYMDQLLESLPEEKIEEFARSEHFELYKKLFEELGIS